MCVEVQFDDGENFPAWEAESRDELSRRLGGPLVQLDGDIGPVGRETRQECLCGIDLNATAKMYSMMHDTDGLTHIFRAPGTTEHFPRLEGSLNGVDRVFCKASGK